MENNTFIVEGGYELSGEITPQGAKNEALEVICATLLTSDEVTISNIPEILDVKNLIDLLKAMGVKATRTEKGCWTFKADNIDTEYIESEDFIKKMCFAQGVGDGGRSAAGAFRAFVVSEAGRRQDRTQARGHSYTGYAESRSRAEI